MFHIQKKAKINDSEEDEFTTRIQTAKLIMTNILEQKPISHNKWQKLISIQHWLYINAEAHQPGGARSAPRPRGSVQKRHSKLQNKKRSSRILIAKTLAPEWKISSTLPCINDKDETAAEKFQESLKSVIFNYVQQIKLKISSNGGKEDFIKSYLAQWNTFIQQCSHLSNALIHFKPSSSTDAKHCLVKKIALDIWTKTVFNNIKDSLLSSVMELIARERNGDEIDSEIVIEIRESFINLCSEEEDTLRLYRDCFLKKYIQETEEFYKINAAEYMELNKVENFLFYADKKLREETAKAEKYLDQKSMVQFMESCYGVLICPFKEMILAECPQLFKRNEVKKLQLMFELLRRISEDDISAFKTALERHIIDTGLEELKTVIQDPANYVEQLVDLLNQFTRLICDTFENEPGFISLKDRAFKSIMNDTTIFNSITSTKSKTPPEARCPEFLAVYCDLLLKKSALVKKLNTEEIKKKLYNALLMLNYVTNKDVFMQFYKLHLTRRLILVTSADTEMEENMIIRMTELGMPAAHTIMLAKMIQDVKLSNDFNSNFKENLQRNCKFNLINVMILNARTWARPSYKMPISLPVELEDFIPKAEELYKKKHTNRKLQWNHHMSTGVISFKNEVGQFNLEVTTLQMVVLFAWNELSKERISFGNLKLATMLSEIDLKRTLMSLIACSKIKLQLLLCDPEVNLSREFDNRTEFWVNEKFAIIKNGKPMKRGNLNMIGKGQFLNENHVHEDNEEVVKLRELRIQEAIVKIMKTRKTVTNNQLQIELNEMLKNIFRPAKRMIKEQIENLIENQYVRRDEDDVNSFVYIA